jgi:hypothetical protein
VFRAGISIATAALTAACGAGPWAHPRATEPVPMELEADGFDRLPEPIGAFASADDAIVRIVGARTTCSGALVAEDLVLTAHHCVLARPGRDGRGASSRAGSGGLVNPALLQVDLGGDYLPWGHVGIRAILAPPCGESGGRGDVAVLVLERKLVGLATLPLRLAAPRAGDAVYTVGFGRCALSPEGVRRRERESVPITTVSGGTFEAQASVCPGDSGGPVFDRVSREVEGVVSLSAMDHDEATPGRSVFARVDAIPKVMAYARQVADGADPSDLPPLSCD